MISVDISNVWGELSLPELLEIEKEVYDAHSMLCDGTGKGAEFREWLNLPLREPTEEIERLLAGRSVVTAMSAWSSASAAAIWAAGQRWNCCMVPAAISERARGIPRSSLREIP